MSSHSDFSACSTFLPNLSTNYDNQHLDQNAAHYLPTSDFLSEYNEMQNVVPPVRRWSYGDSQQASIETTAFGYHNLGFAFHNNTQMSNHQYSPNFNRNATSSICSLGEQNEHAPLTSFNPPIMQDVPSFSHNFYEMPIPTIGYYENEQRSLSAPSINCQALTNFTHHQSANASCTGRRRFRTNFTEQQSLFLEESFKESHYPDHKAKKRMSTFLNIPEDRITVWFQNRRAKWRRKEQRQKNQNKLDNYIDDCSFGYVPSTAHPSDSSISQPELPKMYQLQEQNMLNSP